MVADVKSNLRFYVVLVASCILISVLAFLVRPHDCRSTYGPAPFYYNSDLTLWVNLADKPVENLKNSILANRPLFAYLGWLFAQPVRLVVGNRDISSPTRASGNVSARLATVAGLFLANIFAFILSSILLYHLTFHLTGDRKLSLMSGLLWVTSGFAFAWSYHPVNEMGGLVLIFAFPLFLLALNRNMPAFLNLAICLLFGVLLLMKAYYVMPFLYLVWGILNRYSWPLLIVGTILFFVPTLLWQKLYEGIAGAAFVDFHLGEAGLSGTLASKLLTFDGLQKTILETIANIANFPKVVFNAGGLVVTTAALFFFLNSSYRERYQQFTLLALVYVILFFVFLTLSGFFIPRHGSDFFPLLYPAAAITFSGAASRLPNRFILYVVVLLGVAYTLMTYTLPWLCASEIM